MSDKNPLPPRRVLRYLQETPWAMLPSAFDTMLEVLQMRASGIRLNPSEVHARIEAARPTRVPVNAPGSIAVIPLFGILAQRMDIFLEISEGTSYSSFTAAVRQAVADPNVGAVIIHADSPGGACYGAEEASEAIFSFRGTKPIHAVVDGGMACSAAYDIVSQADHIAVSPSSEMGSIGVLCMHEDCSGMDEMLGLKYTILSYPKGGHKAEGNPHEPLADDTVAHLEQRLAYYGQRFEKRVARGRGVKVGKVQSDFGQGRIVGATQAVEAGMADRLGTLQSEIERLTKKSGKAGGAHAEAEMMISEVERVAAATSGEPLVEAVLPEEDQENIRERQRARARLQLADRGGAAA